MYRVRQKNLNVFKSRYSENRQVFLPHLCNICIKVWLDEHNNSNSFLEKNKCLFAVRRITAKDLSLLYYRVNVSETVCVGGCQLC
jgi:hypothetical protein